MNQLIRSLLLRATLIAILVAGQVSAITKAPNLFDVRLKTEHKVKIIEDGMAALKIRLDMIKRAQKSIEIEYFIYEINELSGRIFTNALINRAQERRADVRRLTKEIANLSGKNHNKAKSLKEKLKTAKNFKIRILNDAIFPGPGLNKVYATILHDHGIELRYYNAVSLPGLMLSPIAGQYRDHRKLLIVDGKEMLTGGRNIGDKYFNMSDHLNFLDREIWVEGAIATNAQTIFNQYWNFKSERNRIVVQKASIYSKKYLSKRQHFITRGKIKKAIKAITDLGSKGEKVLEQLDETKLEVTEGICKDIRFVSDAPGFNPWNNRHNPQKYAQIAVLDSFSELKTGASILVESPYVVVATESGRITMNQMQNQGVDITLVTNSFGSTDNFITNDIFQQQIKANWRFYDQDFSPEVTWPDNVGFGFRINSPSTEIGKYLVVKGPVNEDAIAIKDDYRAFKEKCADNDIIDPNPLFRTKEGEIIGLQNNTSDGYRAVPMHVCSKALDNSSNTTAVVVHVNPDNRDEMIVQVKDAKYIHSKLKIFAFDGKRNESVSPLFTDRNGSAMFGVERITKWSRQRIPTIWGLHAKTVVYNEKSFQIGSFNLDSRAANWNNENVIFCYDSGKAKNNLVSQLVKNILIRKAGATKLNDQGEFVDGTSRTAGSPRPKIFGSGVLKALGVTKFLKIFF